MTALLTLAALSWSAPFDHEYGNLEAFYGDSVGPSGIDYKALVSRRALLDEALKSIASAPMDEFSKPQQLALLINAYNAYTVKTVLDEMPLQSVMSLDDGKLWDARSFAVGGEMLTLNQIEHGRIRSLGDGRIHAALNCASIGCPALQPTPFRAEELEAQLDAASRAWVATNAYRLDGDTLYLSKLFEWYSEDFPTAKDHPGLDGAAEGAVWFLMQWAPAPERKRLMGVQGAEWATYDWSLNAR